MKKSILHLTLLIFNHLAQAQNLQFEWFGERENPEHFAKAIAATPDGGAILVGKNSPAPDRRFDALLVKVDSLGDKIWEKNYGSDDNEEALDVLALPDGSIIFCGYSERGTEQRSAGFVRKVDAAGAEVWYFELKNIDFERITKISATEDGGVLFGGQFFQNNNWYIFYGKLDAAGQKLHFSQPWNAFGTLIRIRENPADRLPIVVRNAYGSSTFDFEKFDWNGATIWRHTANLYSLNWLQSADFWATADGSIQFVYPNSYLQIEVRTINSSGNLASADTLAFAQFYDVKTFVGTDARFEMFATVLSDTSLQTYRLIWSKQGGFEQIDQIGIASQNFQVHPITSIVRKTEQRFWLVNETFSMIGIDVKLSQIETVWFKNLMPPSSFEKLPHEYLIESIKTANGGGMALSASSSPGYAGWLYSPFNQLAIWAVDASGNALAKNLGFTDEQVNNFRIIGFEPTPDGGAAALLQERGFNFEQVVLFKFDAAGKVLFSKKIDLPEPPNLLEKLVVRPDGRFAIPIKQEFGTAARKGIYLLDAEGNWTGLRRIGKTTDDIADVIAAPDGTLVAYGTTDFNSSNGKGGKFLMLQTDGLGGEVQRVETEPKLSDIRFWATERGKLVPTSDGGFVGIAPNGLTFNGSLAIIKFDKNGRAEWSAPVTAATYLQSFSISEIAGRGFVVEQFAAEYGSEGVAAFYERNSKVVLQFIDDQGVAAEPSVISLYPKVEQSNPYFLENYTWHGWGEGLNLATRDLIFIRAEAYRNPNKLPVAGELEIAPNPSGGELSFQFASQFLGDVEVEVFSEIGQRVLRSILLKNSEVFRFGQFEERLSAGVYFVRARAGSEIFCGRWVKF